MNANLEIKKLEKIIEELKEQHLKEMNEIFKENNKYIKKYTNLLNTFKALILSTGKTEIYVSDKNIDESKQWVVIKEKCLEKYGYNYKIINTNNYLINRDDD